MKKRLLDFTLEVFCIQLLKQTQNPSKIWRLDCSCLANFSEVLKIIGEHLQDHQNRSIYARNLHFSVTENDLYDMFGL